MLHRNWIAVVLILTAICPGAEPADEKKPAAPKKAAVPKKQANGKKPKVPKKSPKPAALASDLQRIQGTWQIQAWKQGGKTLAATDLKNRGVFFGANLFVFRRDGKIHQAGPIHLEPDDTPRSINLTVKEGEDKGASMLGIYSLDGDTLRICFDPTGQDRPEEFKTDAKLGYALLTLKKPKPPADETIEIVGKYRSELLEGPGKVTVTDAVVERRGDGYLVTYTKEGKMLFVGTALRKGNLLSMCWISSGQAGVSIYKIEKGPKLVGEYTTLGGIGVVGKEILTPWLRID